jgi:hypothetical protein
MTSVTFSDTAAAIRASDDDREKALGLLREHWLAGRLTLEEYEERCGEAAGARFLHDLRAALRELPEPPPRHWPAPSPASAPAAPAPAPPAPHSAAVASLVLGVLSLLGLVLSFGLLFIVTLPASTSAWALGRRARRTSDGGVHTIATIGETCGAAATCAGCLALAACGMFIAAV